MGCACHLIHKTEGWPFFVRLPTHTAANSQIRSLIFGAVVNNKDGREPQLKVSQPTYFLTRVRFTLRCGEFLLMTVWGSVGRRFSTHQESNTPPHDSWYHDKQIRSGLLRFNSSLQQRRFFLLQFTLPLFNNRG